VSLNAKVNRGVAWAAGAQAIIAIADLVSQVVVVALFLTWDNLGVAFASIPFYTALDYIADLGITSAIIQHDDHTPDRISTMFWMNMLVTGGMFVVLLGLGPLYGYIQGNMVVGWLLVAYGGKLLLQNVYAIPFAFLKKEMRFLDVSVARVIAHLSESAARIVFAAMGYTIWCWTLAALTRAFVFGVIIQMRHPFLPRFVFRPREVSHQIRFGLRNAASNVLYQLYTSLDGPIVFYFFGEKANGIYALADQIVLEPVKSIAVRIGKSYQTVYREMARNCKPDGRYQPWFAHNQAHLRRRRPKPRRLAVEVRLRTVVADKVSRHWSPRQISRWLRRRWPCRPSSALTARSDPDPGSRRI